MLRHLKNVVDRSISLTHLNYLKGQVAYRLGLAEHLSGATHSRFDLDGSVDYISSVFKDYLRYAGVDEAFLAGKRILEIGPGDNLGVGLMFIASGADSYVAVDRFLPESDQKKNRLIYRALHRQMNPLQQDRISDTLACDGEHAAVLKGSRLTARYGCAIESLDKEFSAEDFDVIISRAVLEHVYDLPLAWQKMVSVLKPNGQMWHKVDLRNHGFYQQFHPLAFLTISDLVWNHVSRPDPTLNRTRLCDYEALTELSFSNTRFFLTHVLENNELIPHRENLELGRDYSEQDLRAVDAVRPRLCGRFAHCTDRDLLASGIFLIASNKRS